MLIDLIAQAPGVKGLLHYPTQLTPKDLETIQSIRGVNLKDVTRLREKAHDEYFGDPRCMAIFQIPFVAMFLTMLRGLPEAKASRYREVLNHINARANATWWLRVVDVQDEPITLPTLTDVKTSEVIGIELEEEMADHLLSGSHQYHCLDLGADPEADTAPRTPKPLLQPPVELDLEQPAPQEPLEGETIELVSQIPVDLTLPIEDPGLLGDPDQVFPEEDPDAVVGYVPTDNGSYETTEVLPIEPKGFEAAGEWDNWSRNAVVVVEAAALGLDQDEDDDICVFIPKENVNG